MSQRNIRYWLEHLNSYQVDVHLESTDERIPVSTRETFEAMLSGSFNNFVLTFVIYQGRDTAAICTLNATEDPQVFELSPIFLAITPDMDIRDVHGEPLITHVPNADNHLGSLAH